MSIDGTIRDSLEKLVQPVEDPDAVVAAVGRRGARLRRHRMGTRLLVAAVSIAVGSGVLVAGMSGSDPRSDRVTAGHPGPGSGAGEEPLGRSTVAVSGSNLGPLRVTTSQLSQAEQGWLEHTVTIENTGTETVYVNDHRIGQFLGDREVLAADEGCAWGGVPDEPVGIVCFTDYRPLTLAPGAASTLPVTLWRDLQGMGEVMSDTFVFRKPIVYRDAPFSGPDQSGTEAELVLTYEHLDQPGDRESRDATGPLTLDALAEHLLRTSDLERVVNGLTADSYDMGRDYAVLDATQRLGPVQRASAGVARQWSRPYSWAAGDPVPEFVVYASSTILEFENPDQAQAAAQAIRSLAGEAIPIEGLPAGFVAHGPSDSAANEPGVDSAIASDVQGQYLITVQLDSVGKADRTPDFRALVQAAADQASTLGG